MNIVLVNLGPVAVPFASSDGAGFAVSLEPNVPYTTNSAEVNVASVGDNPTFVEEMKEAAQALLEALRRLITFWRENRDPPEAVPYVRVAITNHGANALRVLLGSNVNETIVDPGESFTAEAIEYVEIRELGV